MSWRVAKSLDTLANEVNARWPGRSKVSDGTLGDQAHAARKSDHNPDARGIVRARDITSWDPDGLGPEEPVAEVVAETLRDRRDPRVKYVIWRGRMFSSYATSTRKAWEWGRYSGPNGHFQHVHVSVVADDRADETTPWGIYPTDNEEGLTVADIDEINKRLDAQDKKLDRLLADAKTKTGWQGQIVKKLDAVLERLPKKG